VPTSAQNPATTSASQSGILFGWLTNGWTYGCCVWNSQNCCLQGIVPVDWWVYTGCYCSMWSGLLHHHDSPPLSWGFTKESWSGLLHYNVVAQRWAQLYGELTLWCDCVHFDWLDFGGE
jgi:hypothetical protein